MGFPNSVDEIDEGMMAEGFDQLPEWERDLKLSISNDRKKTERAARIGFGYWLDNCGDDEWYCKHCLQTDCEKRKWYGW